jgi:hypothetical protein
MRQAEQGQPEPMTTHELTIRSTKGRKRHVAVDTGGLLLVVVVTTASLQDGDGAFRITAALREAFSTSP